MKLWIGVAALLWLVCGLAGAWMLEGRENIHWKPVVKGPITLIKAFNDKPVSYPGPD